MEWPLTKKLIFRPVMAIVYAMNPQRILIITDRDRAIFFAAPFNLNYEEVTITSCESLKFMGLGQWRKIIFDLQNIDALMRKTSLGIRDNPISESFWDIAAAQVSSFILSDRVMPPTRDMVNLGFTYITPNGLKLATTTDDYDDYQPPVFGSSRGLGAGSITGFGTGLGTGRGMGKSRIDNSVLTADDVRQLHLDGLNELPQGAKLTDWALEVANSLNMHLEKSKLIMVMPLKVDNAKQLQAMSEELFDLNNKHPQLYFIVIPAMMPVFNDLFPALANKKVSPTIHWADKGAFTGEISAAMVKDLKCFGAIVPSYPPYTDPKHLKQLEEQAKKHGITLFSTFTLASGSGYDIIAKTKNEPTITASLYRTGTYSLSSLPSSGAIEVNRETLKKMSSGKEVHPND